MNFDSPLSHCSVSTLDSVALHRLAQRDSPLHRATECVITHPSSQPPIDASWHETEIVAPLQWLLSAWVRDALLLRGDLLLRGPSVELRGRRLTLDVDDDSFHQLGLPSRTLDLADGVRETVRAIVAAMPAFAALAMRATWFVDGAAVDLAPVLAAADARLQPTSWRTVAVPRASVRRSGVRVPAAPPSLGAAAIVELVEYCGAAALGATSVIGLVDEHACGWRLPATLPTLGGAATSVDVLTLGAGSVLHPRAIVALLERLPRAPWVCVTVRCGGDAVSFVALAGGDADVHVVCCGQRRRLH